VVQGGRGVQLSFRVSNHDQQNMLPPSSTRTKASSSATLLSFKYTGSPRYELTCPRFLSSVPLHARHCLTAKACSEFHSIRLIAVSSIRLAPRSQTNSSDRIDLLAVQLIRSCYFRSSRLDKAICPMILAVPLDLQKYLNVCHATWLDSLKQWVVINVV